MGWYIAVIVRGTFTEGGFDSWQMGDRLFKLVETSDPEDAYARAVALGEASREDFQEDDGREVSLRYLGLADLRGLGPSEIGPGAEVYSEAIGKKPMEHVQPKEA